MGQSDSKKVKVGTRGTSPKALNKGWLYLCKLKIALCAVWALKELTTLRWYIPIMLVKTFHWMHMESVSDWFGKVTGLEDRLIQLCPMAPAIIELEKHGRSI